MKIIYFLLVNLLAIPSLVIGATTMSSDKIESRAGTIIILNGPSAAGKSSIQSQIQRKFTDLFLKVGIDTFFDGLITEPDLLNFEKDRKFAQYTADGELIRSVELTLDKEGNQIVPLKVGSAGERIIAGMHHAITAYANCGNNLVVDYIMYDPNWRTDLITALKQANGNVYLIGIKAPLEVLEQRERNRGTSPIGHARSHYSNVHNEMIYDLELDVAELLPEQSALKIKEFIELHPNPVALLEMSKKLNRP
ncbi:MAG: chloramphenicol phosphotransferase [Chlamydiales bacterium]|jgi:chloramphenicol 3-O phosphotransferase|nr:chloramphenicol phosphotransferase [Chlamydiales bacterium]